VETEEAQLQIYRYLTAAALAALLALPAAAQTATQTAPAAGHRPRRQRAARRKPRPARNSEANC